MSDIIASHARSTDEVRESVTYDVTVVGGGIVGLATARALLKRAPGLRVLLVEKEPRLAAHQTGHNSGVVHSGIYYCPGSLKAQLCREGSRRLAEFCETHHIAYRRCGKVIVATTPDELPRLQPLYERGLANGVPGLSRIGPERLRELEPHATGIAALHLPQVAIVDYVAVAQAMAKEIERSGGSIRSATRVLRVHRTSAAWNVQTTRGVYSTRWLVNCGGLHADRVARLAGDRTSMCIVPFRGEYYRLPASRASLVRGLIYPVPDPAMPFLGVHFTTMIHGGVHVGPNAVLALKREGYRRMDVSWRDCMDLVAHPGCWRMARRYWKTGLKETMRSWSPRAFLEAARRLVPSLTLEDLLPSPSGVRAQAVDADGSLLDDFCIRTSDHAVHVYNAPSPAATASLSIGEVIAARLDLPCSTRTSLAIS